MLVTKQFWFPLTSIVFFCPYNASQYEPKLSTFFKTSSFMFHWRNSDSFVMTLWVNDDRIFIFGKVSLKCAPRSFGWTLILKGMLKYHSNRTFLGCGTNQKRLFKGHCLHHTSPALRKAAVDPGVERQCGVWGHRGRWDGWDDRDRFREITDAPRHISPFQ